MDSKFLTNLGIENGFEADLLQYAATYNSSMLKSLLKNGISPDVKWKESDTYVYRIIIRGKIF
jgi:hypothetical protein